MRRPKIEWFTPFLRAGVFLDRAPIGSFPSSGRTVPSRASPVALEASARGSSRSRTRSSSHWHPPPQR
ncbi:hypothetical protein PSAB6_460012 [Paraburkholderia sabiae]|nr:hypothetical protein PSAB6_460012 [Paraburkholderia sabiae]